MDTDAAHRQSTAAKVLPSECRGAPAVSPLAKHDGQLTVHQTADAFSRFSVRSLLVWTALVGVLLGLGIRWNLYSFGICAFGVLLWPAAPILHEVASRLNAREGRLNSIVAGNLFIVGAMSFIVSTMGLKPSPSGESFRFLIGR